MELRFTVWEFVRLMVHLEDADTLPPAAQGLRDAWRDIWTSLDEELARLAEEDFDAYSTMMMDQDVVIEDATLDHAHAAAGALTDVMNVMDAAIAQGAAREAMTNSCRASSLNVENCVSWRASSAAWAVVPMLKHWLCPHPHPRHRPNQMRRCRRTPTNGVFPRPPSWRGP